MSASQTAPAIAARRNLHAHAAAGRPRTLRLVRRARPRQRMWPLALLGVGALLLLPVVGITLRQMLWEMLPGVLATGLPGPLAVPATVAPIWALVFAVVHRSQRLPLAPRRRAAPARRRAAIALARGRRLTRRAVARVRRTPLPSVPAPSHGAGLMTEAPGGAQA